MKKICISVITLITIVVQSGCGADSGHAVSTKVEYRDHSTQSSSDYQNGAQNTSEPQAGSLSGDGSAGGLKVGFIQTANESGWRAAHTQSMQDTFNNGNYTYKFIDGQADQAVQIEGIETLIAEKFDVIILAPIVEDGWEDVLKKAQDAEIPVIVVDRMVSADDSLYSCWVGSNFEKEGKDAANWLVETNGTSEKQNMVVLEGTINASAQLGRTKGFESVISKHDNYTILASESGDFDKAKGKALMNQYLTEYDDIDIIVSQNDNMTYGVVEAIEESDRKCSDYTIITFDGEANAFKLMMDGKVSLEVECNPLQGPTVEKLMNKILAGETVDKIQYMEEGVFPAETAQDEIGNRKF